MMLDVRHFVEGGYFVHKLMQDSKLVLHGEVDDEDFTDAKDEVNNTEWVAHVCLNEGHWPCQHHNAVRVTCTIQNLHHNLVDFDFDLPMRVRVRVRVTRGL